MRRILLILALCLWSIGAKAQSATTAPVEVNERVGQAMNASDWFGLARIYSAEKENIDPFLRTYAESLLATFSRVVINARTMRLSVGERH
ncbi:MAG: hypothetical protein IJX68_07310 [Rikenellaceae bacterium]|nr:hypothetical protein [Rikenellaceae bacterium]